MPETTIPNPGFGTYRLNGDTLRQSLRTALEAGYRHIDTAQVYGNETEVGQALAESAVPREEVFLTTKVWHDRLVPGDLERSVEESLARLGTDYLDLLLIHWPSPHDQVAMADYLPALQAVQRAGLTRHIGVSNFTRAHLDRALDILGEGALLTNQVEVHPFLQNRALIDKCRAHGIVVSAYMPLAVGKVMRDETLSRIAAAHGVGPAQVALAWLKARGIVTFPSSTRDAHIRANLAAFELTLGEEDLRRIAALDRGERLADPDFGIDWD
ncbi:2,5-didehydrogluconate reductase DkgB [Halomonas beimenensis]|uniref:Methylglyoxal reductase, acetol producing / 2,5-diketo-D-gluconic acid reductase B n=1 Tax=Halomonas beimenensis TaxID=475662 RepID=A0A291P5G6_9GAMM|nr:2,5-didehydrogluconate reductase DkgB [Halomonas beimenensis]ATJ82112.1 methylglyoxal reductase, acetol producing / 2,5-diketo-D-gluconic acid reductase B [Halomonas beimenensis]